MNPKIVYKYLPPSRISMLVGFTFRLSPPSELNDPYDCLAGMDMGEIIAWLESKRPSSSGYSNEATRQFTNEAIDEKINLIRYNPRASVQIAQKTQSSLLESIDAFGVCAFSAICSSGPMWAHYGEGHRGFALGLDARDSFMLGNDGGAFGALHKVVYSSTRIKASTRDPDHAVRALITKGREWSYEKEWRFVKVVRQEKDLFLKNPDHEKRIHPIPRRVLRRVVFGELMSDSDKQLVRTVVAPEYGYDSVRFFQATRSTRTFKMNIEPA